MSTPTALRLTEAFFLAEPEASAELLEALPVPETLELLRQVDETAAGRVGNVLAVDYRARLFEAMEPGLVARVLRRMLPERVTQSLARLPRPQREAFLGAATKLQAQELAELLSFPPGSAGALMDPRIISIFADETCREALEKIRAARIRRIGDVLVVDREGRLLGAVSLQDLALQPPETALGTLMQPVRGTVRAVEPAAEAVRLYEEQRMSRVPVLDIDGRLLGIIWHEALAQEARRESLQDLQALAGASAEERAFASPLAKVRSRQGWLQINLLTCFLAAAVVGLFAKTIEQVTALAILLPIVAGQSGNTGMQALAVTLRGLTLKEVRLTQWWRVLSLEAAAALLNGLLVAVVTGLGVYLFMGQNVGLTLVITLSMVLAMVIAGAAGAVTPMALKACKQDPAQASSVVLTTITDVGGFFTFLGFATLFMHLITGAGGAAPPAPGGP